MESARSIVKDRESFLTSSSPTPVKKKIVPNQSILTMKPNRLSIHDKDEIAPTAIVPGTAENLLNYIVPAANIESIFAKGFSLMDVDKNT